MAGDISQGGMLIPLLLLVVLWTGVGTVPAVRSEESRGQPHVVTARDTNSTGEGGSNGSGESSLDWLGRHWYVFVVLFVVIVVGCVFLCGCVVRKSQLGQYPLQMNMNGTHHSPPLHTPYSRSLQSMRCSPQRSTYTDDAPSSIAQHTESSFMDLPSSAVSRGSLTVDPNPAASSPSPPNASPWSFIQSAARLKSRRVDAHISGGHLPGHAPHGDKRTASQNSNELCGRHPRSYHHHTHHRSTSNPLTRVSTTHDDGGASVCSAPSTVSMQSDNSNRSKSNKSSHSPSDASSQQTVIEVNVHLRLGKDQLDQAKSVTMAALAESARQLADSAADFGKDETYTRSLPHTPHPHSPHPHSHRHLHPRHSISGATPHSLPAASYLERKHLFHSRSSSHLPPCSEVHSLRPASPRTGQTISLDKRSVRPYHSIAVPLLCAYATEDEGTVVSLDRNSSSSSCHQSSVAMEQGQRSLLSQSSLTAPVGGRVSNIVSLDQISGGSAEQNSTVVSLDRASRSSLRDHRLWPEHKPSPSPLLMNHDSQQGSPSCADTCSGSPCNHTSSSNSSSCSTSRAQLPLHLRHDGPRNMEGCSHPPPQLNLYSCIEEVAPPVKYSSHAFYTLDSSPPRKGSSQQSATTQFHSLQIPKARQTNGYSYPHVPMHSFSQSHSRHAGSRMEEGVNMGQSPGPKGPTYLHNISEQGETECPHSTPNTELGPASMEPSKKAKGSSHSKPTSDQLGVGQGRPRKQGGGSHRRASKGKKAHRWKKERHSLCKEGKKQRNVAASAEQHCPEQPVGRADEEKRSGEEEEEVRKDGQEANGQSNSSGNLSGGRQLSVPQAHSTAENCGTCPSPASSTETLPSSGVKHVSPPRLKKGKKPGKLTPASSDPSLGEKGRENLKVDTELLSSQGGVVQSASSTLPHSPTSTCVSTSQSVQSLTDLSQKEVPADFLPLSKQTSLPEVYPHGSSSAHPLDKTHSLPRTVSGLSISEPLSSTGSGYVATGESGSSLDATSTDENFQNAMTNESTLCSDLPQLTYPLQRLLVQQYAPDCDDLDIFDLPLDSQTRSPFQSIQSHSQPMPSHSGSDSTHLRTHSIPLTYGRMEHVQQFQSVDV